MNKLNELALKKQEVFKKRERNLKMCYQVLKHIDELDTTYLPINVVEWLNEQRNEILDEIEKLTNKLIDDYE